MEVLTEIVEQSIFRYHVEQVNKSIDLRYIPRESRKSFDYLADTFDEFSTFILDIDELKTSNVVLKDLQDKLTEKYGSAHEKMLQYMRSKKVSTVLNSRKNYATKEFLHDFDKLTSVFECCFEISKNNVFLPTY